MSNVKTNIYPPVLILLPLQLHCEKTQDYSSLSNIHCYTPNHNQQIQRIHNHVKYETIFYDCI